MAVLDIMEKEHHLIRDFVDKFQIAVEVYNWGERPPVEIFEKAVAFAEQYVETFHHIREEEILFPMLMEKAGGKLDRQYQSLETQHTRSKAYLIEIKRSIDLYRRGSTTGTSELFAWVSSYLSFIRAHLNQENHLFFPIIERELSEKEQFLIQRLFDEKEREFGKDYVESCKRILAEMTEILEKQYGSHPQYGYLLKSVHSKRVDHRAA